MVDSYTATSVLLGFLVIFGVIMPILDNIPKVRNVVSLRWTLVIIYSAMCLGVILDFGHLDTSVRMAVVIGGILLSFIFIIVRSFEKFMYNHWTLPRTEAKLSHKDTSAELVVSPVIIKEEIRDDKAEDKETVKETENTLEETKSDKENS